MMADLTGLYVAAVAIAEMYLPLSENCKDR
jgi:hypothetical protein